MEYLIQEILLYLIIACGLGAAIGWFVSQQGSKSKIAALEAQLSGSKTGTPIESIEGIGEGFGKRLKADGISTTEALRARMREINEQEHRVAENSGGVSSYGRMILRSLPDYPYALSL